MRGRIGILIGALAGFGIVGVIVWLATREAEGEREEAVEESAAGPDDEEMLDEWGLGDEGGGDQGVGSGEERGGGRGGGGEWGGRGAGRGWSPDREMLRRRVEIVPLGDRPPEVEPDELMAVMREQRPAIRECVQQAGGWRQMREMLRAQGGPDAGRRRPRASFDLGPDGRIVPGTLALQPQLPEELGACVSNVLMEAPWPQPGGDGARVEMPMGPGRRGGFGGRGDGGVGGGGGGWRRGEGRRWPVAPPGSEGATAPAPGE